MNKQEKSKLHRFINDNEFPTMYVGWGAEREVSVVDSNKLRHLMRKLNDDSEKQKVKVPAFGAEYLNYCIANERTLAEALSGLDRDFKIPDYLYPAIKWLEDSINQNIFAQAWLDGFEIEEEPKWVVRVKEMFFLNWGEDGTCPTFVIDDNPGAKRSAKPFIKSEAQSFG